MGLLDACSDTRGPDVTALHVEGRVIGNPAPGGDAAVRSLQLHGGLWWPTRTLVASVASDGTFAVPTTVHALILFRDTDHDGTLDRFAEPSSPCSMKDGRWRCAAPSSRLYLHRIARRMDGEVADKTHVIFDAYDAAGRPDTGARVCVARGQCSERGVGPFYGANPVALLSLCDVGDGDLQIETMSGSGTSTFLASAPRAVPVEVTHERGTKDGDVIHVRASQKISWAIAWLGVLSDGATSSVRLTTGTDADGVTVTDDRAILRLPARQLEDCPSCSIIVQVAFDVTDPARPETPTSYFEYQEVFAP